MGIAEIVQERLNGKIISWQMPNSRRYYLTVKKEDIVTVARVLFEDLSLRFCIASGVDTPEGIEILYHFSDDKSGIIFSVRTLIEDKNSPEIDSLVQLFSAAEWIEREMWEMLGINFRGHPNLKRLLLAEDWPEGEHPLRQKK